MGEADREYWRARYARQVAEKAAGMPTRIVAGIEVESAVKLYPYDPMACWLAALVDGEGHFACKPPKLSIGMCDRDVLETALRVTGAGSIIGPYKRGPKHHKPISVWRVNRAADCFVIGHMILPFLGERRTREFHRQCEPFLTTMTAGKMVHGTRAYYKRGCRCVECIAANSAYFSAWSARHAVQKDVGEGVPAVHPGEIQVAQPELIDGDVEVGQPA